MANSQLAFDANGTLSRVWLAAHWEKKLTKNSICSHDIQDSVATIKAPGNVYSLRISGYLLLGLTKIYSKKSIITLEELEQSLQSLTYTTTAQSVEVLKEIGITDVPDKLKLVPLKKPEFLAPIAKNVKIHIEKVKNSVIQDQNNYENSVVEENDLLGLTTSFLDDVEMAEEWLRKDNDEIDLPSKRPRERTWRSFINTNLTETEEPQILFPEISIDNIVGNEINVEQETKEIVNEENNEKFLEKNKEKINAENNTAEEILNENIEPRVSNLTRPSYQRKILKDPNNNIKINAEVQIGLDSTADIVKNTRLFQPLTEILPSDIEQIFYVPLIKEIAPELENFYLSHIKIQRLKNFFREEEEKEPVILSNTVPERPENPIPIIPQGEMPEIDQEIVPLIPEIEPKIEKIEKIEDKTEDTWSSRTLKLLKLLKVRLNNQRTVFFEELSKKSDRKVMACGFYEILQLCLKDFICLEVSDNKILLRGTERLMRMSVI